MNCETRDLIQIAYGLMIFWITTMLALLYDLLGEFSVALLLTRIPEFRSS